MDFGLIYDNDTDTLLGVSNEQSMLSSRWQVVNDNLEVIKKDGVILQFRLRHFSKCDLNYLNHNLPEKQLGFTWKELLDEYRGK